MQLPFAAGLVWLLAGEALAQCPSPCPFISYEAASPALKAYAGTLPQPLTAGSPLDADARWAQWVQAEDGRIRARLERGEEDTLSNLLRFGVTFTREYRITDDYLPKFGESSLVNAFAENRANDLIRALASPSAAEGFRQMRLFVEEKGYSLRTTADRARLRQYLLANLARLRDDFLSARTAESKSHPWTAFASRGISLDTNLWPDYDLDVQLEKMAQAGMLRAGSIRRIAIVGPGLDFVNKQEGLDFYPPQTLQPFAALDSLLRLGLAAPDGMEVYTLDISPNVNAHLRRAQDQAAAGQPYSLQLPWFAAGRWRDDVRQNFMAYWQRLGACIGKPAGAIPIPNGPEGIETRAIEVRPDVVSRIRPAAINIVFQRLTLPEAQSFDLIIGTNIFIYYGEFEQSLARANIASMLHSGGYLLTNERLADRVPSGLDLVLTTGIPLTGEPVITESFFSYLRR